MEAIARWAIIRFKTKYWGLKFEEDLPPEFIVTVHAKKRAEERLKTKKVDLAEHTIRAWYKGGQPPRQFDLSRRPSELRYKRVLYRYHSGVVWVFGIRWIRQGGYQQKHLITILPISK